MHSEWARERIAAVSAGVPATSIKHHITELAAETPKPERAQNGKVTIASFGGITRDKAIDRALSALSALREEFNFEYVLVGSSANFPDLPDVIRQYELEDRVTLTNYVGLEEFQQRILAADIAINLRERPVGATSGSLCRLMAAGVPTIVSNVGAFSEVPDNAVDIRMLIHKSSNVRGTGACAGGSRTCRGTCPANTFLPNTRSK